MLNLDRAVTENYCRVMRGYFSTCDVNGKADSFFEFETVIKFNGVPFCKVKCKNGTVEYKEVGKK